MKLQVQDLRKCLEKLAPSSKCLDMILGTKRVVYNKTSLGYRTGEVAYTSIINITLVAKIKSTARSSHPTHKIVKVWVPKQIVGNTTRHNILVPKHLIFLI